MRNLNLYKLTYIDNDGWAETQYVAAKNPKEIIKEYPETIGLKLIDLVVVL